MLNYDVMLVTHGCDVAQTFDQGLAVGANPDMWVNRTGSGDHISLKFLAARPDTCIEVYQREHRH